MASLGSSRCWRSALTGLALIFLQGVAQAQSGTDELARRRFEAGAAYLEESDYRRALAAFEQAYDLSKRPEILLSIATAHERNAEPAAAIEALNEFLAVAQSDNEHLDTAKRRIRQIQQKLLRSRSQTPIPIPTPAAAPTPAPAAALAPAPPPTPMSPTRLPAFIALGIGGAAAGAAALTGILAVADYNEAKTACNPACPGGGQAADYRPLALTSALLAGTALIGVGAGITLLLTSGPDPAQTSLVPRLRLAGLPGAARASVDWRF